MADAEIAVLLCGGDKSTRDGDMADHINTKEEVFAYLEGALEKMTWKPFLTL
jgi:DNA-binding phage protein